MCLSEVSLWVKMLVNLHTELASVTHVAEGLALDIRHKIPSGL